MILFDLSDPDARGLTRQFGLDEEMQQREVDAARRHGWSPMTILTASYEQAYDILAKSAPKAAAALCPPWSEDTISIVTAGGGGVIAGVFRPGRHSRAASQAAVA